jgi:hypothetical protein
LSSIVEGFIVRYIYEGHRVRVMKVFRRFSFRLTVSNLFLWVTCGCFCEELTKPQWNDPEIALSSNAGVDRIEVVDFDQDGDPDIVSVISSGVEFWRNNGSGGFDLEGRFVTPDPSFSIELGDWDQDGDLDFVSVLVSDRVETSGITSRSPTPITVWLNNGTESFVRHREFFAGSSEMGGDEVEIEVGDTDQDGDLDLVISVTSVVENPRLLQGPPSRELSEIAVYHNDGLGGFSKGFVLPVTQSSLYSTLVLGDLDGDSDLDLVRRYSFSSRLGVWTNDGVGQFSLLKEYDQPWTGFFFGGFGLESLRLRDIDTDGDLDVPISMKNGQNFFLQNDGAGFLSVVTPIGIGSFSRVLEMVDLNGDGITDLIANGLPGYSMTTESLVESRNRTSVRIGEGDGGYAYIQKVGGAAPKDVRVADFNLNGLIDIAVLFDSRIEIWLQGAAVPLASSDTVRATIEDSVVRDVISKTLGKTPETITRSDLATITELDFSIFNLTHLTIPFGIAYLDRLNLGINRIVELRVPYGMNIEELIGSPRRRIVYYNAIPELGSPTISDSNEFSFDIDSSDGQIEVEMSRNLSTWESVDRISVEEWKVRYSTRLEDGEGAWFFRLVNRGFGD